MAKSQLKKMCKNVRIARTAKVLKIVSGLTFPKIGRQFIDYFPRNLDMFLFL